MDLTSRDGRGQCYKATENTSRRKEISLVTANSDIFTDLLTDRTNKFGLELIVNFSTSGTGAVNVPPRNISGEDI